MSLTAFWLQGYEVSYIVKHDISCWISARYLIITHIVLNRMNAMYFDQYYCPDKEIKYPNYWYLRWIKYARNSWQTPNLYVCTKHVKTLNNSTPIAHIPCIVSYSPFYCVWEWPQLFYPIDLWHWLGKSLSPVLVSSVHPPPMGQD